ncbi:radical SAM/SPASM domain-containing protein [Desulfobacula sp.]|uniref:radical SAM/SPASM domain-containing protein n=1 Tax=Desulfobacula sp. TaxID=2593537 RepID=UPI001ED71DFD|nr:radical SAM protein [Desulfobacula sp.]
MHIPSSIILEVSALCNVSCLGCALHGPYGFVERSFGNMKKEIWESVIREIGSWDKKVCVSAHGGGEPLMNPDLRDILTLARSFPNIEVGFLTNGMLMDESWAEFIINVNLDWIAFSIDGVTPETHDKIRWKSDLAKVEKNLETLLTLKKKKQSVVPRVKLNMVAYDAIMDQKEAFVERWINKVDEVMVSHYRNPPESKRWPNVPEDRKPCSLLWSQAVIAWDGRLGLCCEDFNIDHSPGSVGEDAGLLELWNGPEFTKVRSLHQQGQFAEHSMCRVCDTWAEAVESKIFFHEKGYRMVQTPSQTVYSR